MAKISEFVVNTMVDVTLVVMSATARETKSKKPYLQLELYDGTDAILANYWDWTSGKIPEKNAILDVYAQVTEYMGVKQLNVKTLTLNADRHLSEFMPTAAFDIADVYKEAYALTSEIKDDFLRGLTLAILEQLKHAWLTVPGAKSIHHAFVGGTLVHCLSVANIARAISENIPGANEELCFIGGMLHDLGKLYTYRVSGVAIEMTDEGMLYDHTFMGAEFVGNFVEHMTLHAEDNDVPYKLEILRHIILSHHGSLEHGAPVPPMCIEAHIVHHADGIDAVSQQIIDYSRKAGTSKWTDRIYALGNRPHLTVQYVEDVFSRELTEEELPFK